MKLPQSLRKEIIALKQKKQRENYDKFVVEGFTVVDEALKSKSKIEVIIFKNLVANNERAEKIIQFAKSKDIPFFIIDNREFAPLSSLETPPGILAVLQRAQDKSLKSDGPFLILDEIKDPGNLGTIIRTADWFGFNNIIIGGGSVDVYNPKVLQATMGSIFHVNIKLANVAESIREIKNEGYKIVATTLDGNIKRPEVRDNKFAIIMGNETTGLREDVLKLVDYKYKISGKGEAESLNVSIATAIVLYEMSGRM